MELWGDSLENYKETVYDDQDAESLMNGWYDWWLSYMNDERYGIVQYTYG